VTAPEAAKHLKALDALYTDLSATVRRAVAAAPALPAAQTAARAIAMDARDMAGAAPSAIPAGAGMLVWVPLVLLVAGLSLLLAAAARDVAHAPHGRAPAHLGGCTAPRERPQPAGDPAAAR